MTKDEHPPEMVDAMFLHGLIGRPSPNSPIPATLVTRLKENRLESSVAIPAPERPWSQPEWERIEAGHLSQDMDDKWHGYVENDRLYLHRSWTGDRLYEAQFQSEGEVQRIIAAVGTTYERRSAMRPETDSLQLEVIIETVFLNVWNKDKIDRLLEYAREEGFLPPR